ncbi:hypothetical protein EfmJHP10_01330 [Enterococcus faecium]|nr:hypothetical protein EfmJHP10_01330 [Enterococcus faecium]
MTYTHLTPNELVMIEAYFHQETPVAIVAKQLKRGRQTIYNVYNFLKCGGTALEYFEQYKENKRRCGRTEIIFPAEEKEYIEKRSTEGWTPDVGHIEAISSKYSNKPTPAGTNKMARLFNKKSPVAPIFSGSTRCISNAKNKKEYLRYFQE